MKTNQFQWERREQWSAEVCPFTHGGYIITITSENSGIRFTLTDTEIEFLKKLGESAEADNKRLFLEAFKDEN